MPFLKAGFNGRNYDTGIRGWTRHRDGGKFKPAELRMFACGDYFWYGASFLAWGESVVIGSHWGFDIPWEFQNALPRCDIDTRREFKGNITVRDMLAAEAPGVGWETP